MSVVYFTSSRSTAWNYNYSLPAKLEEILKKLKLSDRIKKGDRVAVKTHLGSEGAFRIVRPYFLKIIVDAVKEAGGIPFITDTCRIPSLKYLELARANGITHGTVGAPVIIADGIKGGDGVVVKTGEPVKNIAVAAAIFDADAMIVVSHFKGHIQAGFGGAVKNISMGCVCQNHREGGTDVSRGKLHMEERRGMTWDEKLCTLCGNCIEVCPTFSLRMEGEKIIRDKTCWYCMRCERVCPTGAMKGALDQDNFQKSLAQAAKAVLSTFKKEKVVYLNFNLEMQPGCDCMPVCDNPVVQDSGIFASDDIVAVDDASYKSMTFSAPLPNSAASDLNLKTGDDVFGGLYPKSEPEIVFKELEKSGVGKTKYKIEEIVRKK